MAGAGIGAGAPEWRTLPLARGERLFLVPQIQTHGSGGRESALTEAAQKDFLWVHYNGGTDVLIVARASLLLLFVESHRGQSGICFKAGVGDGQRASGFVVPVSPITGQPWVKSYPDFSGSFLTGSYALSFS